MNLIRFPKYLKDLSREEGFVCAVFLLIPLAGQRLFGTPLYPLDILAFLLILFSLMRREGFRDGVLRVWHQEKALVFGTLLFLVGTLLAFFTHERTLTGWGELKSWILVPLSIFLATASLKERIRPMFLWLAWLAMTAILASVSLWGWFNNFLTFDGRLAYPENSPNFLAELLAPGLLLCFFFGSRFLRKNILFVFLPFLLLIPFLATRSYGAWLAFFLAAFSLFLSLRLKGRGIHLLLLSVFFSIAIFGFYEIRTDKFTALSHLEERSSLASRIMIWKSAASMLHDEPFLGIGLGRFQTVYLEKQSEFPPYLEWAVPEPHNFFLSVWLSSGLLGLLGMLVLLWWTAQNLFFLFRAHSSGAALLLSLSLFLLVFGFFDTPFFRNDLSVLFFLFLLLVLLEKTRLTDREGGQAARLRKVNG